MLLGGLWHGANWTFVLWGGIHGIGLAAERFVAGRGEIAPSASLFGRWVRRGVIFQVVCFAWIFFRIPTMRGAWDQILSLGVWHWNPVYSTVVIFLAVLVFVAILVSIAILVLVTILVLVAVTVSVAIQTAALSIGDNHAITFPIFVPAPTFVAVRTAALSVGDNHAITFPIFVPAPTFVAVRTAALGIGDYHAIALPLLI